MQALTKTELFARLHEANQASQAYIAASPQWVQIWVLVLTVVLLPALIFAFRKSEARWIALGLVQAAVFTPFLIAAAGASKIWGLTHILFWIGPLMVSINALTRAGANGWYGRWLAAAAAAMTVSLIFDLLDVLKFLRGAG